jgi:hypothetical protein
MSDLPNPRLLLGEGVTDLVVVNSICDRYGIPDDWYEYENLGGIKRLLDDLPSIMRESDRRYIAVVLDADQNPSGRWQSLRDRLRERVGYELPPSPTPGGTIVQSADPQRPVLGVWMMPDNSSPGMVEDFLRTLVRPDDTLFQRAVRTVARIPVAERRFSPLHLTKARMYTWAAWQEDPGTALGNIIKRGELDATAAPAQALCDWIRKIFPALPAESGT